MLVGMMVVMLTGGRSSPRFPPAKSKQFLCDSPFKQTINKTKQAKYKSQTKQTHFVLSILSMICACISRTHTRTHVCAWQGTKPKLIAETGISIKFQFGPEIKKGALRWCILPSWCSYSSKSDNEEVTATACLWQNLHWLEKRSLDKHPRHTHMIPKTHNLYS